MKKVLSLVAIMLVVLVALTGCVNVNYEVTLNKDGSADVAYVYGFDKSMLSQMGTSAEDMTSDMKKNAEASEYEIEAYSDDEMEGFKAKKHVENISEISFEEAFGEENVKDSEENQFKIEKKGVKTVYSQKANIDLSSMDASMASMVTMKYTVNLPTKVGDNNASEISKDGKTLTWNLKAGEINEINFEASSSNVGTVITIAVIALAVIGVGVAVIIFVNKSKKDKIEDKKETAEVVSEVANVEETEKVKESEEENKQDKE